MYGIKPEPAPLKEQFQQLVIMLGHLIYKGEIKRGQRKQLTSTFVLSNKQMEEEFGDQWKKKVVEVRNITLKIVYNPDVGQLFFGVWGDSQTIDDCHNLQCMNISYGDLFLLGRQGLQMFDKWCWLN